jgi:outer membrane protein
MKRIIVLLALFAAGASALYSQQLTRLAVVDLPTVYTVFFRDSKAVRDFEDRAALVQADFDRMTKEIQQLQRNKVDAEQAGDKAKALSLDAEIYKKSDFLREYYRVKTAELDDQRKKLSQSDEFLQQVLAEIRRVAESEGYSMVLNLKESAGILWYSPTVDITDKVIQNLQTNAAAR